MTEGKSIKEEAKAEGIRAIHPAGSQENEKEGASDEHGAKKEKKEFVPSAGLTSSEVLELRRQWGRNEVEEKKTPSWLLYARQLYQPMPIMIWIAVVIEAAIQNWADFAILIGILFTNATLGWYESTKAGDAVAALKASLKPQATAKRDGKWIRLDATELVPGDLVLLGSGSNVPADCIINPDHSEAAQAHGGPQIDCDQAALTGESLPVTLYAGDDVKMGSTVVRGEVEATVEFTGRYTFFGRTAAMLQVSGNELGHLQKILLTIMIVLVVLSLVLCFTAFGYLLGTGERVKEAISFTVVLLVASIPIAIEIVCTTTLALGSRQLSKHGAIVTRLAAIEDMAGLNMLCSDKTGTLTLNKMVIQETTPVLFPGLDQKQMLVTATIATKWTEPARDALDTLVLGSVDLDLMHGFELIEYHPFDPAIKRTTGIVRWVGGKHPETGAELSFPLPFLGQNAMLMDPKLYPGGPAAAKSAAANANATPSIFRVTKGAPHVLMALTDDEASKEALEGCIRALGERGVRALAVAFGLGHDGPWHLLGLLTFLDPPRPDTKETIHKAMSYGVDVKMITGDHLLIAKETSRTLGLGTNIQDPSHLPSMGEDGKIPKDLGKRYGRIVMDADGFAQVFPDHKFLIVETLRQNGFACGMTGDGVNDAPALKRDAVQGATDAARAAADIVLTQPGLSTIVDGMVVARQIFQRMQNFINYRIAATLQLLCFFFIAVFALKPTDYAPVHRGPFDSSTGCLMDEATRDCSGCPGFPFFIESDAKNGYPDFYCSRDNNAGGVEGVEWPSFFSLPVKIMLMLITLLNDGTLISVGYDHVKPSPMPEKWNLKVLFLVSAVLGAVACGSSLLLLWAALDSWSDDGLFRKWGISAMPYGHIVTMIYLKVSISDFLTLFSARTHDGFFWSARPSPILVGAAGLALTISTILGCAWPKGKTDGIPTLGLARGEYTMMPLWIWIYCLVWWIIQDGAKVLCYHLMRKFNVFNINNAASINLRDANNLGDAPLARASIGMVESKLLHNTVDNAMSKVERLIAKRAGTYCAVSAAMESAGVATSSRTPSASAQGSGIQRASPVKGVSNHLERLSKKLAEVKKQGEIQRASMGPAEKAARDKAALTAADSIKKIQIEDKEAVAAPAPPPGFGLKRPSWTRSDSKAKKKTSRDFEEGPEPDLEMDRVVKVLEVTAQNVEDDAKEEVVMVVEEVKVAAERFKKAQQTAGMYYDNN
eukprot:CAMPEP_0175064506 /NCGR_PEP_ID=MMETSP0052_2-20121109/15374_1 /TAXON_ID=51329 ORGANISM="Polytomella parva, Strain SAG 63-3" /NCGR_SAMPLE_ID=MMETSP0052_2 /ASSEMBLY_ACC=CAM_ASM_000194 /LENGTH=1224 /DNA_ID=CAMNT_0016330871 /DNA_START=383 /DNA_END=4057 /DNA_ORIENTATION=+